MNGLIEDDVVVNLAIRSLIIWETYLLDALAPGDDEIQYDTNTNAIMDSILGADIV